MGVRWGNPLSVVLSNIYMAKLERDVVEPSKPILNKRYIDDVFSRKKKGEEDTLINKLNSYHKNIRFPVEKDLTKFLDTRLELRNGEYQTRVNRNRKLPMHWSSKVPKKFKRNIINNDLHRANVISSDFCNEINEIRQKYTYADYQKRYVESVIKSFNDNNRTPQENRKTNDQRKLFILIKVPFCPKNEEVSKQFLNKPDAQV